MALDSGLRRILPSEDGLLGDAVGEFIGEREIEAASHVPDARRSSISAK
jgi:hypothetical protein